MSDWNSLQSESLLIF